MERGWLPIFAIVGYPVCFPPPSFVLQGFHPSFIILVPSHSFRTVQDHCRVAIPTRFIVFSSWRRRVLLVSRVALGDPSAPALAKESRGRSHFDRVFGRDTRHPRVPFVLVVAWPPMRPRVSSSVCLFYISDVRSKTIAS